jgi:tetratricopeptide (TPR) repeat protein
MEAVWTGRGNAFNLWRAIQIDSTFTSAYFFFSIYLSSLSQFNFARKAMLKAYEGVDQLPLKMQLWLEAFMAQYIAKNPFRTINHFEQVSEIDPLSRLNWFWLGSTYNQIENYEDALLSFEEILKLNKQFGEWKNQQFYNRLGNTYIHLKKYNKAQKILEEGLSLFPEAVGLLRLHAVCDLLKNDTNSANQYLDQLRSTYGKVVMFPESWIISLFGKIYFEVGQPEKAEKLFRQALEMRLKQGAAIDTINPGNNLYWYYDNLGSLLISSKEDVEEGMDYIQKAMELSKEAYHDYHPYVLYNLGSGLYKQGKYEEALQALKQADDNMSMYDHPLHQLMEKVEEALANQNQ